MSFQAVFARVFLGVILISGISETRAEKSNASDEVLATYVGGVVTRGELAEAVESLPSSVLPRLELEKIRTIAQIKYLSENSEIDPDDLILKMTIMSSRNGAIAQLFTKSLADSIEIPSKELEERFRENRTNFYKPERRRIRHIYKSTKDRNPSENADLRRHMEEIRRKLVEGFDFEEMARQESEAKTKFDGGEIGNVIRGQFTPEVESVVFALEKGEISQVVEYGDGLHLFRCESIISPRNPTDDEIRLRIRNFYRQSTFREKWNSLQESWLKEVVVDTKAIRSGSRSHAALEIGDKFKLNGAEVSSLLSENGKSTELNEEEARNALRGFIVNARAAAEYLEHNELPEAFAKGQAWRNRKIQADQLIGMRIEALGENPPPTVERIRELYERNKTDLVADKQYLIESIAVRVEHQTAVDDTRSLERLQTALADDPKLGIYEEALEQLSPSTLERTQITPPSWKTVSALRGGGKAMIEVLSGLESGETSPVFRTTFGNPMLRIIRLHETRESRPLTFEESKPGIEDFLQRKELESRARDVESELLREMKFQFIR